LNFRFGKLLQPFKANIHSLKIKIKCKDGHIGQKRILV
jgi:hypothetical protein